MKAIGERLKTLRGVRSMQTMADLCQVTRGAWNNWEKGTRTLSLEHLKAIGDGTGSSLDWIINGKGNPP